MNTFYRRLFFCAFFVIMPLFFVHAGDEGKKENETLIIQGASTSAKYIPVSTNLDAAASLRIANAFVDRGQVNDNRPVVQPEIEISKYEIYLNLWGNLGLSDQVTTQKRELSEIDITLGYKLPLKQLNIRVGLIDYIYPNVSKHETREVFMTFEYPSPVLRPRVEAYYDFDEANGAYLFLALEHQRSFLSNKLRLTPGISSGWGSSPYNNFFFSANKAAFDDGSLYTALEYDLTDKLTFNISAAYTWLWNAEIREGAEKMYYDTKQFVFGAKVTYDL